MQNIWKNDHDTTRCDWTLRQTIQVPLVPHDQPVVTAATRAPNVYVSDLARRATTTTDDCRRAYTITGYQIPLHTQPKDMRVVQNQYESCLVKMHDSCSRKFWDIFLLSYFKNRSAGLSVVPPLLCRIWVGTHLLSAPLVHFFQLIG